MRSIITQVCNGTLKGQVYNSDPNPLDKGNSGIFASSLFVYLDNDGKNVAQNKDTDDKIVVGYTKEGMAFQIVVDGFYGCDRFAVFSFIDNYVIPLMEGYSSDLSGQNDSKKITERLIHTMYSLRDKHAPTAEFTMSIGMTYKKDNELYCAGFGIGDTGMVIKRTDGTIEQLAYHTEVDGFKDAFDAYSASNIDSVIERNTLFNTKVEPGDELVGYTYVPQGLEQVAKESEIEIPNKGLVSKLAVKNLRLDSKQFNNEISLFSQVLQVVETQQQQLVEQAKKSGQFQRFGDDFTVGRIVIPDLFLMNRMKVHALSVSINEGLAFFITHQKNLTGLLSIRGFFNGAKQNIEQAITYQNIIKKYSNEYLPTLITLSALVSQNKESAISKYLAQHLNIPSLSFLNKQIEELMLNELQTPQAKETIGSRVPTDFIDELRAKVIRYINNPTHNEIDSVLKQFVESKVTDLQQSIKLPT